MEGSKIPGLSDSHWSQLEASGVAPHVASRRGYRTAAGKADLGKDRCGFSKYLVDQLTFPVLIVPMFDVRGEAAGFQLRPDEARWTDGKAHKYAVPKGSSTVLDIHTDARDAMSNPAVPLVIVEGIKKADAGWSIYQLPCISIMGVDGWSGRNAHGGGVVHVDWRYVPMKGKDDEPRHVLIAFDSDIQRKPGVLGAATALARVLTGRGAAVFYLCLEDAPDGSKVGLDDFALTHPKRDQLWARASTEPPECFDAGASDDGEPVDDFSDLPDESGADLADELVKFFSRFVVFPSTKNVNVIVLWLLHAHALPAFDTTARLALLSPERETAKTRVLELLRMFVPRPWYIINPSPASLFRKVELSRPVVLLDEVDGLFDPKGSTDPDIRTFLNAGHRRGQTVPRCVGEGKNIGIHDFPVFAAVAYAGIGKISDVLLSRSVVNFMKRRAPDEVVERFYERRIAASPEVARLKRRLEAWAKRRHDVLAQSVPDLPGDISDRAADVWEPLFACADQLGGDWPKRAREAASGLNKARLDEEQSIGTRMLTDLRTIFDESTRIPTQVLLPDLWKLEESPWGDWNYGRPLTARQLAGILKPYGVKPKDYDFSGIKLKGYDVADGLGDAWRRYCAKEPAAPYGEGNKSDKRKPPASDVADTEHVADPQWEDRDHRARAPESNDPLQWDESGGVQL